MKPCHEFQASSLGRDACARCGLTHGAHGAREADPWTLVGIAMLWRAGRRQIAVALLGDYYGRCGIEQMEWIRRQMGRESLRQAFARKGDCEQKPVTVSAGHIPVMDVKV